MHAEQEQRILGLRSEQEQRILGLRSLEPGSVLEVVVQGYTCLANVDAEAFSTWNAVHWYWVLVMHKLLPQVLKRQKVTWMARGIKALWFTEASQL